ncbi:MAG: hypothetical protein ACLF0G_07360 [Candidatus Brocadiia bacterium]
MPSKNNTNSAPRGPGSGESGPRRRLKGLWQRLAALFLGERILCDTCKYDYGDVCRRPERPNATRCPDYQRK